MNADLPRTILSSIGDAVVATDRDGRITFVNPAAESLLGWRQDEAKMRPFGEVFRSVDERTREPTAESPVAHVLRVGARVELPDHTLLISRDGVKHPIEDSAAPIRDERGKMVGVVMVFRDAGKRRAEERRREHLLAQEQAEREQAEEANRIKDEFLATLSRELRTPLGAITAWVKLLQQPDLPPEEAAHGLEVIDRSVRAQTQMISDLLVKLPRQISSKGTLPARAITDRPLARSEPPPKALRAPPQSRLQGLYVLVVEDDDDSREVVRIVLRRYGAEVAEASSVPEALEQMRHHVPDVLISDIGMPGEDGYSLLRKLRKLPDTEGGRVPALALTAFARRQDHDRALQDGFQLHLTKPVSPATLSEAVAQLAGRA